MSEPLIVDTLEHCHRDREWSDRWGKRWRWAGRNEWVVDDRARFGGFNPDDYGPFSEVVT